MNLATLSRVMGEALDYLRHLDGRLRYARRRAGLSQAQAAEQVGVARNTITRYERGDRLPSESTIAALADIYDVEPEWLRNGSGDDRPLGASVEERRGAVSDEAIAAATAPQVDFVTAAADAVVCPTCGVRGILRRDLIDHLRGETCDRRHSLADAIRLTREAQPDLEHPKRWIQHLTALIDATDARTERLKPESTDLREFNRQIVAALREQLRQAIEKFGDA